MNVVDEIAAQGVQNGAQDGPPVAAATIARVTVPEGALEGTGTYVTASPESTKLPTDGCPPTVSMRHRRSVDTAVRVAPTVEAPDRRADRDGESTGGAG